MKKIGKTRLRLFHKDIIDLLKKAGHAVPDDADVVFDDCSEEQIVDMPNIDPVGVTNANTVLVDWSVDTDDEGEDVPV